MFAHIHDSIPGNLVQYGGGDEVCGDAPRATAGVPTAPLHHPRPYYDDDAYEQDKPISTWLAGLVSFFRGVGTYFIEKQIWVYRNVHQGPIMDCTFVTWIFGGARGGPINRRWAR